MGVYGRVTVISISRARTSAILYTDSRTSLTEALGIRDGAQVGAIDEVMGRDLALGSDKVSIERMTAGSGVASGGSHCLNLA